MTVVSIAYTNCKQDFKGFHNKRGLKISRSDYVLPFITFKEIQRSKRRKNRSFLNWGFFRLLTFLAFNAFSLKKWTVFLPNHKRGES